MDQTVSIAHTGVVKVAMITDFAKFQRTIHGPLPEIENEEVQEDDDVVRDELLTPRLAGVETDWPNNSCDVLAEINHLRTDPKGFSDQYLVPMLENFSPYDYGG